MRFATLAIVLGLAACEQIQVSPAWVDPAAPPAPLCHAGDGLDHERFYGLWTVDRDRTVELNHKKELTDPLAAGVRFEKNGVLVFDRLTGPQAGTWRPQDPDKLIVRHPGSDSLDYYNVEFDEGALRLRNRQTGDWTVLTRPQAVAAGQP